VEEAGHVRIYGAGIVSSAAESVFALESGSPNRIGFDMMRVMRTPYRIDDFQQVYVVVPSFETLRTETLQDFGPIYAVLKDQADIPIEAVLPGDKLFSRGDQAYANAGGRFAAKSGA
jgi:phenylalanine-4-hydroxylase